eukprot:5099573-Pyramimonas_sp.AAC.1
MGGKGPAWTSGLNDGALAASNDAALYRDAHFPPPDERSERGGIAAEFDSMAEGLKCVGGATTYSVACRAAAARRRRSM